MERYTLFQVLGDGSSGRVYKAIDTQTSEFVAIKRIKRKFYVWEECLNLREVKSLCSLNHPNIIKLKEIVGENNELFFVFEYMEYNLYQIMQYRQSYFSEKEIRDLMYQLLQGLAYMHKNGYFHRDLKPENLLVTDQIIKVADFGLAREVSSVPPFTEYVSTRWYRAPEVLLQSSFYTPSIDMWAVGAILAELFTLCPIFRGDSEIDQLYKICRVLGKPDWNAFPEANNIFELVNICHCEIVPPNLDDVIPDASPEAIDLIKQLCSWDPLKRPTADECLRHPFFHVDRISKSPRTFGDDLLQIDLNRLATPMPTLPPTPMPTLPLTPTPDLGMKLSDFDTQPDDECFLELTLALKPSIPNLDVVHNKPSNSSFQNKYQSSVILSFDDPDPNITINGGMSPALESSPPLSLSLSSSSAQASGFNLPLSSSALWPNNCMDQHHHDSWLAMSSCCHHPAQLSHLESNGD